MKTPNASPHDNESPTPDLGTRRVEKPFQLYSPAELLGKPYPAWLIKNFIERHSLAMLYGKPACGKSFLALELAFHVAMGRTWRGHKVKKAPVVYVAAEGIRGIRQRVEAFLSHNKLSPCERVFFLLRGIDLEKATDLDVLARRIEALGVKPELVVVDTLARCFHGDENDTGEMSKAIGKLDEFRRRFDGMSVLLVHHTNKGGEHYRGSSALEGALDCMIRVEKSDNIIFVTNDKQKDAPQHRDLAFRLHQVLVCEDDGDGDPITSCVLVEAEGQPKKLTKAERDRRECLLALQALGGGPVPNASWQKAVVERGVAKRAFDHLKKPLVDKGWIVSTEDGDNGRAKCWSLTEKGREAAKAAGSSHSGNATYAGANSDSTPSPWRSDLSEEFQQWLLENEQPSEDEHADRVN